MKSRYAAALALVGWYLPLLLGLGLLVARSGAMPQQNSFDSFRAASPQPGASQHSDHLPFELRFRPAFKLSSGNPADLSRLLASYTSAAGFVATIFRSTGRLVDSGH